MRLILIYLEKLIKSKAIIGPVVPNISIVSRSLFPWTNSFLPSESILQPIALNKSASYKSCKNIRTQLCVSAHLYQDENMGCIMANI
jgi:hypothetical protein